LSESEEGDEEWVIFFKKDWFLKKKYVKVAVANWINKEIKTSVLLIYTLFSTPN
jgi:hypothetical protein